MSEKPKSQIIEQIDDSARNIKKDYQENIQSISFSTIKANSKFSKPTEEINKKQTIQILVKANTQKSIQQIQSPIKNPYLHQSKIESLGQLISSKIKRQESNFQYTYSQINSATSLINHSQKLPNQKQKINQSEINLPNQDAIKQKNLQKQAANQNQSKLNSSLLIKKQQILQKSIPDQKKSRLNQKLLNQLSNFPEINILIGLISLKPIKKILFRESKLSNSQTQKTIQNKNTNLTVFQIGKKEPQIVYLNLIHIKTKKSSLTDHQIKVILDFGFFSCGCCLEKNPQFFQSGLISNEMYTFQSYVLFNKYSSKFSLEQIKQIQKYIIAFEIFMSQPLIISPLKESQCQNWMNLLKQLWKEIKSTVNKEQFEKIMRQTVKGNRLQQFQYLIYSLMKLFTKIQVTEIMLKKQNLIIYESYEIPFDISGQKKQLLSTSATNQDICLLNQIILLKNHQKRINQIQISQLIKIVFKNGQKPAVIWFVQKIYQHNSIIMLKHRQIFLTEMISNKGFKIKQFLILVLGTIYQQQLNKCRTVKEKINVLNDLTQKIIKKCQNLNISNILSHFDSAQLQQQLRKRFYFIFYDQDDQFRFQNIQVLDLLLFYKRLQIQKRSMNLFYKLILLSEKSLKIDLKTLLKIDLKKCFQYAIKQPVMKFQLDQIKQYLNQQQNLNGQNLIDILDIVKVQQHSNQIYRFTEEMAHIIYLKNQLSQNLLSKLIEIVNQIPQSQKMKEHRRLIVNMLKNAIYKKKKITQNQFKVIIVSYHKFKELMIQGTYLKVAINYMQQKSKELKQEYFPYKIVGQFYPLQAHANNKKYAQQILSQYYQKDKNKNIKQKYKQYQTVLIQQPQLYPIMILKYQEKQNKQMISLFIDKLEYNGFEANRKNIILKNSQKIQKIINSKEQIKTALLYFNLINSNLIESIKKLKKIIYSHKKQLQNDYNKYQQYLQDIENYKKNKKISKFQLSKTQRLLIQRQEELAQIKQTDLWKQLISTSKIMKIQDLLELSQRFHKLIETKINLINNKNITLALFEDQYTSQFIQILKIKNMSQIDKEISKLKRTIDKIKDLNNKLQIFIKIMKKFNRNDQNNDQDYADFIKFYTKKDFKQFNLYEYIDQFNKQQQKLRKRLNITNPEDANDFFKFVLCVQKEESQNNFVTFRQNLKQNQHALNGAVLNDLIQRIIDGDDIQVDLEVADIQKFIKVLEHIKITEKCTSFDQYIRYLQKLKRELKNQYQYKQMIERAKQIKDDLISIEGYSQNSTPKSILLKIITQSQYKLYIDDNHSIRQKIIIRRNKKSKGKNKEIIILKQIPYQQLVNFKQSSLLFKNDLQKDAPDQRINENCRIYDAYLRLFNDTIQKIHNSHTMLISYGYNPQKILQLNDQIYILKGQSQSLVKLSNHLQLFLEAWIIKIKQLYQKSFTLTHFIGAKLNNFINDCIVKTYNPTLKNIINLEMKQFNRQFADLQLWKIKQTSQEQYVKIIELIVQTLKKYQTKFIQKSNYQQKDNNLLYITCQQKNIYYNIILNEKKIESLRPNRLFFCLEDTSFLQLQCFLYRSIIDNSGFYYFICPNNLSIQIKDQFSNLMVKMQRQSKLANCKLCFIDQNNNHSIFQMLSKDKTFEMKLISEQKNINYAKNNEAIKKMIENTLIVQSQKAGMGKSFYIRQLSQQKKRNIKYFPIAGYINYFTIQKRLKSLQLKSEDNLVIEIGLVENRSKLQIFLAQLILLRSFYFQQFVFLPSQIPIFIQMQNMQIVNIYQSYHILNILKTCGKIEIIGKFQLNRIKLSQTKQENFMFTYLQLSDKNLISTTQIQYESYNLTTNAVTNKKLIQKYFIDWFANKNKEPTFIQYQNFKKMLFNYFKVFSHCIYFKRSSLRDSQDIGNNNQSFRGQFIKICIDNTLRLIEQTVQISNFVETKFMNENQHNFNNIISGLSFLIVSRTGNESQYCFAYLNDQSVPDIIKKVIVTQNWKCHQKLNGNDNKQVINNLFAQNSLGNLSSDKLQEQLKSKLKELSKRPHQQIKQSQFYQLTLDNFYKMCMIIQKANCFVPIVIMGQSGVGKTVLIQYLVENIFKEQLRKINVHAGVDQQFLRREVYQIREQAIKLKENEKIWVFFDQFNTTSCLSYIKQIIMDRRFLGQKLPDNITFIAACNPYRLKKKNNFFRAGLQKIYIKQNQDKNQLAFHVMPPSLSMIQVMWNYNQLKDKQLKTYIQKIINKINYNKKKQLVECIRFTHQQFVENSEISSVSLRDVARFKLIFDWFKQYMPTKQPVKNKANRSKIKTNYNIPPQERAIILSFMFSYVFKFSTNKQREMFLGKIEPIMGYKKDYMKNIMSNEQQDYVSRLIERDQKIAINTAIKQNILITLICITNKIPVLIIGSPGSSKTLSVNILIKHLQSMNNQSQEEYQFIENFPKIMAFYYQGSVASTSQSILAQFTKAQKYIDNKKQHKEKVKISALPCIIFDQIGLAQKSKYNPLKVLHSKLQTNKTQICFIGISNYVLDSAKMSRFLILARSPPDKEDIIDTAVKLNDVYSQKASQFKNKFKQLGQYYNMFIQKWNSNNLNLNGFFGLRDFYSYIKYISNQLKKSKYSINNSQWNKIVSNSICLNFDGQENSINLFHEVANLQNKADHNMNIINMVSKNLKNTESRSLLLIIKGDMVLPIINKTIKPSERFICLYGSPFYQDQSSANHAIQIISMVLDYAAMGKILAFKDINQNIQTSLYDLFNKNFYTIGGEKFCKVAVGDYTKLRSFVHQQFNSIIYINEQQMKFIDRAFINRFEKHQLSMQKIVDQKQMNILNEINKWLNDLLSFIKLQTKIKLKRENFILNISHDALLSLIVKYKEWENDNSVNGSELIRKIKIQLLKNSTIDLDIAMKKMKKIQEKCDYRSLKSQIKNPAKCSKDMIIFTYDQQASFFSDVDSESTIVFIRFNQFKCQSDLRKSLKKNLKNADKKLINIFVNYQLEYKHVNFLLYIVKQMKIQTKIDKPVNIYLLLHRFTLHNLKKDNIGISYLYDYEQYFIEDIKHFSKDSIIDEDLTRLIKPIFLQGNYAEVSQKLISSAVNLMKIIFKTQQNQFIHSFYKEQCLQLTQNNLFIRSVFGKLEYIFQYKQINLFNYLEKNYQQISTFSNIEQFLVKQTENQISKIIFLCIKMLINDNLLFPIINTQSFIDFYVQSRKKMFIIIDEKQLRQKYIQFQKQIELNAESNNKFIAQKIQIFCDSLIKYYKQRFINKQLPQQMEYVIKSGTKSNPISIIEDITLIPLSSNNMNLIFQMTINVNSLQILISKNREEFNKFQTSNQRKIFLNQQINKSAEQILQKIVQQNKYLINIKYNTDISWLYFYDFINYYLRQVYRYDLQLKKNRKPSTNRIFIQQERKQVELIRAHFANSFNNLKLSQIFILFTSNRKQFNLYIQLLQLIQYPQMSVIQSQVRKCVSKKQDWFNITNQLLAIILKYAHQSVTNSRCFNVFANISDYLKYFKLINLKIKKIMRLNQKIVMNSQFNVLANFYFYIQNNFPKEYEDILSKFQNNILSQDTSKLLQLKIIQFCINNLNDLKAKKQNGNNSLTVDYLCFKLILPSRMQMLKKHVQFQKVLKQIITIINSNVEFANKSGHIMKTILQLQYESQLYNQLSEKIKKLKLQGENFKLLQQFIDFQNNYSMSLDNYFVQNLQNYFKNQQNTLKKEFNNFIKLKSDYQSQKSKLCKLFNIAYMKIYCQIYLNQRINANKTKNQYWLQIQQNIKDKNEINSHLKMFMFRKLLQKNGSLKALKKQNYVQNIEWLSQMIASFQKNETQQIIIPPAIQNSHDIIKKLKQTIDDKQIFSLIQKNLEDLESPIKTYGLLTYFMIQYYRNPIITNETNKMKQFINKNSILNQSQNILIKNMIIFYLNGKISNLLPNKNEQDFKEIAHLLNSVNILISLRNISCPITDTFFESGEVAKNMNSWLQERALLCSMQNPALLRIQYFINMKSKGHVGNNYIKCSKNCDFITSVGGTFFGVYYGCAHTKQQGICLFCKGIIGGKNNTLTRASQGAYFIAPDNLNLQCNKIKKVQNFNVNGKTYSKKGYQMGNSIQAVKQYFQEMFDIEGRVTEYHDDTSLIKNILQSIIYFFWFILIEMNQIKEKQAKIMFKLQIQECKQFLLKSSLSLNENVFKKLYKEGQNKQNVFIWHFGFSKHLFNFSNNYNKTRKDNLSLKDQQSGKIFQNQLDKTVFAYYDSERQRFINQNKLVLKSLAKTYTQAFTIKTYPFINLYRNLNIMVPASIAHLLNHYQNAINKNFQILSSIIRDIKKQKWLIHVRNIYLFISEIYKECNHKITREDAKKQVNQFIKQFFTHSIERTRQMTNMFNHFINGWNYLANARYELVYECHNLGQLKSIDSHCQLKNCIVNAQDMSFEGPQLIAIILATANQYNSMLTTYEAQILSAKPQYKKFDIFDQMSLSPIKMFKHHKFLQISKQLIEQKIKEYSNYSVQNGIKNINYTFSEMQADLIEQIIGISYINGKKDDIMPMNYIGQNLTYLQKLRDSPYQKTLRRSQKIIIIQMLKDQNRNRPDIFFKNIKKLQSSLEHILIYFQDTKTENFAKNTIEQFIKNKRIMANDSFLKKDCVYRLKMQTIIDFYQLIEFYSFEKVIDQLPDSYKSQKNKIQDIQGQKIEKLIVKMKNISGQTQRGLPNYELFKYAFYRLVGRVVIPERADEEKLISDFLFNDYHYWSKNIENQLDQFKENVMMKQALDNIKFKSTKWLLELIPHNEGIIL